MAISNYKEAHSKACSTLRRAVTPHGILALVTEEITENYNRVWSRDSIMVGYAGLLANDAVVIAGLKSSLNTLRNNQSAIGIIPSNVALTDPGKVSYGGTAGRVDATLWYIIGVLIYVKHTGDQDLLASHKPNLDKAMHIAQAWELNGKHLIYTPLSGNWADEYPLHGYTLYDNCLRLWGLRLATEILDENHNQKALDVEQTIKQNFFLYSAEDKKYHANLYNRTREKLGDLLYPVAGFNPSQYYAIFDCGGTGLALMLDLFNESQVVSLTEYLSSLFTELGGRSLVPAFWPVIDKDHPLWQDIEMNYAYDFKNYPHHFHNGGIWPIMMGWLCKGLRKVDSNSMADLITEAYINVCHSENYSFSEYIRSDNFEPHGKAPLCYSAAGLILMNS